MDVEGEIFERIYPRAADLMLTHENELIRLADGLAAKRSELGIGEIKNVVVA